MDRYRPFSHAHALVDQPISRCGSTVLLFLEPKDVKLARPAQGSSSTEDPTTAPTSTPAAGQPSTDTMR